MKINGEKNEKEIEKKERNRIKWKKMKINEINCQ